MSTNSWFSTPATATPAARLQRAVPHPGEDDRGATGPRFAGYVAFASAFLVTLAASVGMLAAWADAYFRLAGEPAQVTPAVVRQFGLSQTMAAAAAVVTLVLGFGLRRTGTVVAALAVSAVALGTAAVFAVPADRWVPEPAPRPTHDVRYQPCYSGSNDCPGG